MSYFFLNLYGKDVCYLQPAWSKKLEIEYLNFIFFFFQVARKLGGSIEGKQIL